MAAPIVLIMLGVSCLIGAGSFLVNVLAIRPIPGMYVTAAAVLASLALYMLWLAWARWPEPTSKAASPANTRVDSTEGPSKKESPKGE